MINTRKLVYGHAELHDCLAFADGETAAEEAREIVAIASARTWGEARAVESRHIWNPAAPEFDDEHDDDAPFKINDLGTVIEGNWPPMVTARALRLVPKDLREQFGHLMDTVHNGDYLEVPLTAEAGLVAALRDRGYEVVRDDKLINTLDGQTFRS
ncbi:hypothetical protein AB0J83_11030 [Actinoplanes sp. NPDC049596]|uniref:hypothetical protein n=1 Tax=unclassified Actinoplanes TaxID=2626549 RepID=UPI0034157570